MRSFKEAYMGLFSKLKEQIKNAIAEPTNSTKSSVQKSEPHHYICTPTEPYAKAVFLNAYKHSPLLAETGKTYYRYIETECGINNPDEYHRQLIADGYLVSDKKDANCYSLTEKGKHFLQDHSDCVLVHKNRNKFNMDWEEYVRTKVKLGDRFRYFDVVWSILNERSIESGGYHAYEYHQMYTLLKMEGRKKRALEYLLNFLYLELNNTESIKDSIDLASHPYTVEIMTKDSWPGYFLQLTAHNLKELNELKEFYSEDMAERVFQKMQRFPVVICDLATFKSVIKSIFNGTYNEEKVNSKLRRKWNAFIKSLQNN